MVVARLIRTVSVIVAGVIVVAIILHVLSANPHNMVVSDIHDAGSWLVGPFHNVFSVRDAKLNMALNWGLAALVYLLVGDLLSRLIGRSAVRTSYGRATPVA